MNRKGVDQSRAYIRKRAIIEKIKKKCKDNKISYPNLNKMTTKELTGFHGLICQKMGV